MTKRDDKLIAELIERQWQWIEDHGNCESEYVALYGSKDDPHHVGDGGEAIYAADVAYLASLEARR